MKITYYHPNKADWVNMHIEFTTGNIIIERIKSPALLVDPHHRGDWAHPLFDAIREMILETGKAPIADEGPPPPVCKTCDCKGCRDDDGCDCDDCEDCGGCEGVEDACPACETPEQEDDSDNLSDVDMMLLLCGEGFQHRANLSMTYTGENPTIYGEPWTNSRKEFNRRKAAFEADRAAASARLKRAMELLSLPQEEALAGLVALLEQNA